MFRRKNNNNKTKLVHPQEFTDIKTETAISFQLYEKTEKKETPKIQKVNDAYNVAYSIRRK